MKYFYKIILILSLIVFTEQLQANTLMDSLNSAYANNPKLNAERAGMRASREEKREAISEFLPNVTISGYISEQDNTMPGSDTNFEPSEQALVVEQKIFQGFGGIANYKKKKYGQELGEYKLKKIEQEVLLEATKAHADFLLSKKKVEINLLSSEGTDSQDIPYIGGMLGESISILSSLTRLTVSSHSCV